MKKIMLFALLITIVLPLLVVGCKKEEEVVQPPMTDAQKQFQKERREGH